jgi:hypothetical protein
VRAFAGRRLQAEQRRPQRGTGQILVSNDRSRASRQGLARSPLLFRGVALLGIDGASGRFSSRRVDRADRRKCVGWRTIGRLNPPSAAVERRRPVRTTRPDAVVGMTYPVADAGWIGRRRRPTARARGSRFHTEQDLIRATDAGIARGYCWSGRLRELFGGASRDRRGHWEQRQGRAVVLRSLPAFSGRAALGALLTRPARTHRSAAGARIT